MRSQAFLRVHNEIRKAIFSTVCYVGRTTSIAQISQLNQLTLNLGVRSNRYVGDDGASGTSGTSFYAVEVILDEILAPIQPSSQGTRTMFRIDCMINILARD